MRRHRFPALLLIVAAFVPAHAGARPTGVHDAAKDVRAAIPAGEAYAADHGTYAGMTLAKLRAYDRSIRRIAVRRATKKGYCIQSTRPGPVVHYDGPAGPLRHGRCGVRGAVYTPPAPVLTPQQLLQRLELSIELYRYEHGGSYEGMTLAELQKFYWSLRGITVKLATSDRYCVETDAAPQYHLAGPNGSPAPGACPPS